MLSYMNLTVAISARRGLTKAGLRSLTLACLALLAVNTTAQTQTQPTPTPIPAVSPTPTPKPTPAASPTPTLERRFFKNVLHDQYAIWTSPFHAQTQDVRWLAPLALGTGVLLATDGHTAGALDNDDRLRFQVSKDISYAGSFYGAGTAALGFYLIGRARHNQHARETGLLAGEALLDSGIVSSLLKAATGRVRPTLHPDSGEFLDNGNSFPSGHAISAWSVATVVAHEYHKHLLVQMSAYGIASAVSVARYTGRNHFLSDVLVGSALGYGIGRYVYRTHHSSGTVKNDLSMDAGTDDDAAGDARVVHARSKLWPLIAPQYEHSARLYGATLAWSF